MNFLRAVLVTFLQVILGLSRALFTEGCREGEVRLVADGSCGHGRVRMCLGNSDVRICGNEWGEKETKVVCGQLGYERGPFHFTRVFSGEENTDLTSLTCNGNETRLSNCMAETVATHECKSQAQVTCAPNSTSIRLVDGTSHQEGRVELCLDGLWQAACSDEWTERETALACAELGLGSHSDLAGSSVGTRPISRVINCTHSTQPEESLQKCRTNMRCHTSNTPNIVCSDSPLLTNDTAPEWSSNSDQPTTTEPLLSTTSPPTDNPTSTEGQDPPTNTEGRDPTATISVTISVLLSVTIIVVASTSAAIYIAVLKRKARRASFQDDRDSMEDIVEIDNTIYDDPIQCAATHTMEEEEEVEKLNFHNPTYESYVAGEYEVAVECCRPSGLMESAKFDDEIYSTLN